MLVCICYIYIYYTIYTHNIFPAPAPRLRVAPRVLLLGQGLSTTQMILAQWSEVAVKTWRIAKGRWP